MIAVFHGDFWLYAIVAVWGATMGFILSSLHDAAEKSWWPCVAATIIGLGCGLMMAELLTRPVSVHRAAPIGPPTFSLQEPPPARGFLCAGCVYLYKARSGIKYMISMV